MKPENYFTKINIFTFREILLAWFDAAQRALPWRGVGDAYAVLVSEFMLQQTTVVTAIPYFERWMRRFPDVASLAAADADEALRLWSGLGYYARARNLRGAARAIVELHGGRVPSDIQALRALPGVGDYTAAAVASIAFGISIPAVDANAARVFARLGALPGHAKSPTLIKAARTLAELLIDPKRTGDFNQAIMELGALVCAPGAPDCGACPVSEHCRARRAGIEREIPARAPRPEPVAVAAVAALVRHRGRVLLRRRPDSGPMRGLWELPGGNLKPKQKPESAAARFISEQTGLKCIPEKQIATVRHTFTHHCITIHVITCATPAPTRIPAAFRDTAAWTAPARINDLPITGATRKILIKINLI